MKIQIPTGQVIAEMDNEIVKAERKITTYQEWLYLGVSVKEQKNLLTLWHDEKHIKQGLLRGRSIVYAIAEAE